MTEDDRRPLDEWLRAAYEPGSGCPPPERFLAAEAGELPSEERERLEEHARTCPACAAERDLARLFHGSPETAAVDPDDLAFVTARLEERSPVERTGRVVPFPGAPERGTETPRARPRPASRLAPVWRLAAAAVLAIGGALTLWTVRSQPPLPEPPSAGDVMRGGEVEIVSPSGDLDALPAELRWVEKPEAQSYRVRLTAVDDTVLWETAAAAPPVRLPEEIRRTLHPAVAYTWTVEALDAAGARLAASEPARFRVRPEPER